MTTYSVQQIKFECLSYIKEFGAQMDQWVMGIASDPQLALASLGVDLTSDIWLWKPALSQTAAHAVLDFFTRRYQVRVVGTTVEADAQKSGSANCVFMFKRQSCRTDFAH